MLCQDCPTRNSCLKLCREAEDYVGQDYVPLRELRIGLPMYGGNMSDYEAGTGWYLSDREKRLVRLMGIGLSRKEITEMLGMSRESLRQAIFRIRHKVVDVGSNHGKR
jgi:DNA-binding CsgD family transcriptional regulator